jgi:hypothetical protein
MMMMMMMKMSKTEDDDIGFIPPGSFVAEEEGDDMSIIADCSRYFAITLGPKESKEMGSDV